MDGFEWGKGVSCLELSTSLKFLERGEEANFFVIGHFLCFNGIFWQVFAYGGQLFFEKYIFVG